MKPRMFSSLNPREIAILLKTFQQVLDGKIPDLTPDERLLVNACWLELYQEQIRLAPHTSRSYRLQKINDNDDWQWLIERSKLEGRSASSVVRNLIKIYRKATEDDNAEKASGPQKWLIDTEWTSKSGGIK